MLIENPDSFKTWLTSILEPLCDADPEALAKYVFALVKKDKPVEELRDCMVEQLDVFLQTETKPFVELLFKTLENQDYLTPVIPNANPPNPNVVTKKEAPSPARPVVEPVVVKDMKPIISVSSLPNLSESVNGTVKSKPDENSTAVSSSTAKRDVRKSDSEKEESSARPRTTRNRHRSNSRNRSRSRSWDRLGKRSRSRDRSPRIERRDRSRPWRNKSPPRRYDRDRRRSRSSSPIGNRMRSRSRSPRHSYRSGGRYRNRSPPRSISRSRSRSNERSNRLDKDRKESKLDKDDNNSGGATPTQDSNHGDTDMRLTNTTQSIQSVVNALNPPVGGAPNPVMPSEAAFALAATKRRCRDFDEKGYCMRGEMCPYDHGIDPVVLEDTALTRVLTFGGPNGAQPVVNDGPSAPGPPGMMHPMGMLPGFQQRMGSTVHTAEYNPSAPGMWHHRPGFRSRGPGGPLIRGGGGGAVGGGPGGGGVAIGAMGGFGPMPVQRELINVPVMDNMQPGTTTGAPLNQTQPPGITTVGFKRRANDYNNIGPDGGAVSAAKKRAGGGFDFSRLGPRSNMSGNQMMVKNPANCSLELKKVPRGMNNITHLNNHFSKFGKIVNIQVCFEGDPEGAIVTFSSHAEANAAYRSTEAVLNNRFIKVFWHTGGENIPPPMMGGANVGMGGGIQRPLTIKDRLGQPVNSNKVLNLVQPKAAATADTTTDDAEPAEGDTVEASKMVTNSAGEYVPSTMKKENASSTTATTTTTASSTTATTTGAAVTHPSAAAAAAVLQQQKEDSKALANAAIVKNQEILAAKEQLKKKHEEKRKEAIKITQDLRKRKQELLEKQLAQQKLLIEKLEKTNPTGQQRELLMSTIKTVQESIESIRKDMVNSAAAASAAAASTAKPAPAPVVRKTKEEAQRELLDAELDLITRQQEGGDTTELQRKLIELRSQVTKALGSAVAASGGSGGSGGLVPGGGGITRRGSGGAGGGRGALRSRHHFVRNNLVLDNTKRSLVASAKKSSTQQKLHTVVDHRPTRLLVSGYEGDETDSVITHFAQYGEIMDYVSDDSTPSIVFNYRTRKEAEIAVLKGKHFQDRTLSVTWCTDGQYVTIQRNPNSRTVVLVVKTTAPPTPTITSTTVSNAGGSSSSGGAAAATGSLTVAAAAGVATSTTAAIATTASAEAGGAVTATTIATVSSSSGSTNNTNNNSNTAINSSAINSTAAAGVAAATITAATGAAASTTPTPIMPTTIGNITGINKNLNSNSSKINSSSSGGSSGSGTNNGLLLLSNKDDGTGIGTGGGSVNDLMELNDDVDDNDDVIYGGRKKENKKTDKAAMGNDDDDDVEQSEEQLLEGDDENISADPLGLELSEEVLLQDDEEDIDEDEDRSWRR